MSRINLFLVEATNYNALVVVDDLNLNIVKMKYLNNDFNLKQIQQEYKTYNYKEWSNFYYKCFYDEVANGIIKTVTLIGNY